MSVNVNESGKQKLALGVDDLVAGRLALACGNESRDQPTLDEDAAVEEAAGFGVIYFSVFDDLILSSCSVPDFNKISGFLNNFLFNMPSKSCLLSFILDL